MRTITFRTSTFTIYMMYWSLPKTSMNRTNNFYRIYTIFSIYSFRINIFITMYFSSFLYKFFSSSSTSSKTFRTPLSSQMMCRSLPEFAMFWTYNTYFCSIIYILNFGIIIFIFMNFSCLFNKFIRIRRFTFVGFFSSTFWTSFSLYMTVSNLPKFSVCRTDNADFIPTSFIIYFRIIIFISVYNMCFLNPFFCC